MTATQLRVGFYTGRQIAVDGGRLVAEPGLGRVVGLLGDRFPGLVVAATEPPAPDHRHTEDVRLDPDQWVRLPYMPSFLQGATQARACHRVMRELEARCDIVVVQLAFQAPLALLRPQTPRVYHVFGDVRAMARSSSEYTGARHVAAKGYAALVDRIQRHVVGLPDTRLVTNGEALRAQFGIRGRAVVSATLSEREIGSVGRTRPPGSPHRILFVGYLRPEKGIDVLVDAVERLRSQGLDVEVEIVGPGESAALGPEVATRLGHLRDAGVLVERGSVPFGPDLFEIYANADVLVLPSRTEGTPRVLVEARAFGCPIVATDVGGIPTSIRDGFDGVLVKPDAPADLAAAITRVLSDEAFRDTLVRNGFESARERTVERFTDQLADEVETLAATRRA